MIAINLRVRRAERADQQKIANLMYFEARVHRHLDWRAPLEWLGSPHYWVLEDGKEIGAALACPQEPPGIAWIRLFTYAAPLDGIRAWTMLWETAVREIAAEGKAMAAAICLQPWFEDILRVSRFSLNQNIIMLEWDNGAIQARPRLPGIHLRDMLPQDLPAVADVDAAAFEPLWRNSPPALASAYSQRAYATVAEGANGLLGYQLSTGSPIGAHLARLAVRPEAQGSGVGMALVGDLLQHFRELGRPHITVNTQSDNVSSQALYQRMGFIPTGEQFPVFIHPIQEV